jgi:hypothetical protein
VFVATRNHMLMHPWYGNGRSVCRASLKRIARGVRIISVLAIPGLNHVRKPAEAGFQQLHPVADGPLLACFQKEHQHGPWIQAFGRASTNLRTES